ncbi:MAG: DUF1800 domain-containing protein [Bacteroidetes bacterium]|nr:MAG: DUF1800 domain-containing protein [Bacteroidota bacterium]
MDRREFVTAKKKNASLKTAETKETARTFAGLTPYNGPWTSNEVIHLLKRTMFGSTPDDINFFLGLGINQSVDTLLTVSATPPAPPVKNYNNNNIPVTDPDYNIAMGQTWVTINTTDAEGQRRNSLKAWWMGLMINQERNIREKMTLFWANHFSTETNDLGRMIWAYNNNALCRKNALGNFKQFVRDVTLDAAMLRYLNGYLNISTAPDENYGRELQELFTLGKENNPNYTEDDVKKAARVLTGWKINANTNTYSFNSAQHDTTSKQFSSFYNNTVITGRSGATAGDLELTDLIDMIFSKSTEVSRFIVKKLYRYFVYYKIDAATETNVISPLAQLLVSSNWEIKPVLAALFKSEHFFDIVNQGCYIKSPVDLVVSVCREFGIVFPNTTDYVNAYNMWSFMQSYAALLQQNIGDPPNVAGWAAYYQAPQFHETWINADTYPRRNLFTDTMIGPGYTRSGQKIIIDPVAFTKKLSNPSDPNILMNDALRILFRIDLSAASKTALKNQILLSNQAQDYYWTNAWTAYINNPIAANYQVVYTRLRDLYKYLMDLAEYQLC